MARSFFSLRAEVFRYVVQYAEAQRVGAHNRQDVLSLPAQPEVHGIIGQLSQRVLAAAIAFLLCLPQFGIRQSGRFLVARTKSHARIEPPCAGIDRFVVVGADLVGVDGKRVGIEQPVKCREHTGIELGCLRPAKGRKQVERELAGTEQAGTGAVADDNAILEHQVTVLAFQQVALFRQHADQHDLDAVPALHPHDVIRVAEREGFEIARSRDHCALGQVQQAHRLFSPHVFEANPPVCSLPKVNRAPLEVAPLVLNDFWPQVPLRTRWCRGRRGQMERRIELVVHAVSQRCSAAQSRKAANQEHRIGFIVGTHAIDPVRGIVEVLLQRASFAEERHALERPGQPIHVLELLPVDVQGIAPALREPLSRRPVERKTDIGAGDAGVFQRAGKPVQVCTSREVLQHAVDGRQQLRIVGPGTRETQCLVQTLDVAGAPQ